MADTKAIGEIYSHINITILSSIIDTGVLVVDTMGRTKIHDPSIYLLTVEAKLKVDFYGAFFAKNI